MRTFLRPGSSYFWIYMLLSSLLSGYLCSLGSIVNIDGPANPYPITIYPGAVFGLILTFCLCLRAEKPISRQIAFIFANILAYRVAVWLAMALHFDSAPWVTLALAGCLGAVLVALALRILLLKLSLRDLRWMALIGAVGGSLFFIFIASDQHNPAYVRILVLSAAYFAWQGPVGAWLFFRHRALSTTASDSA